MSCVQTLTRLMCRFMRELALLAWLALLALRPYGTRTEWIRAPAAMQRVALTASLKGPLKVYIYIYIYMSIYVLGKGLPGHSGNRLLYPDRHYFEFGTRFISNWACPTYRFWGNMRFWCLGAFGTLKIRIRGWKMIHFDGGNVSGRLKYDIFIFWVHGGPLYNGCCRYQICPFSNWCYRFQICPF